MKGIAKGRSMAIVFTKKQYHQLVKEDFWTKIELHFVLFGDEHPILRDDSVPLIMYDYKDPTFIGPVQPDPFVNLSFHGPITSDKIPDPNVLMYSVRHNRVQSLMDSIDGFIDDYVQLEKLIKTPNTIHREIKTLRNPYIFSINETGYQAIGLYKLLEKKQVVVIPPELIKSMEEGGLNMAVSLLPKLHENMIYLLNHGRNPPRLNSSFSPEPQAEPVEDAPESIKRGRLRANTSTDKIDTPLPTLKD